MALISSLFTTYLIHLVKDIIKKQSTEQVTECTSILLTPTPTFKQTAIKVALEIILTDYASHENNKRMRMGRTHTEQTKYTSLESGTFIHMTFIHIYLLACFSNVCTCYVFDA